MFKVHELAGQSLAVDLSSSDHQSVLLFGVKAVKRAAPEYDAV